MNRNQASLYSTLVVLKLRKTKYQFVFYYFELSNLSLIITYRIH